MKKVISDSEQKLILSHVQKNGKASILTGIIRAREHARPPSIEVLDEYEKEIDKTFSMIDLANKLGEDRLLIQLLMPLFEWFLRERGRWKECLSYGELMRNTAIRSGDKVAEGWALVNPIGWTLIQQGKYQQAIDVLQAAMEAFKVSNNIWGTWQARRFIGQAYRDMGRINKSQAHLNMAYDILIETLYDANKIYGLNIAHFRSLPYKFGGFVTRQYLTAKNGFNLPEIALSSNKNTLRHEAIKYIRRKPYLAVPALLRFLWAHASEYFSITLHLYGEIGCVECCRKNFKDAESYLKRSIIGFRLLGRELDIGIYMVDYGDVARAAGKLSEAQKRYDKAIKIAEKYQRKMTLAEASIGLSEIMQRSGQHAKSLELQKRARELCEDIGVDYVLVEQRIKSI